MNELYNLLAPNLQFSDAIAAVLSAICSYLAIQLRKKNA